MLLKKNGERDLSPCNIMVLEFQSFKEQKGQASRVSFTGKMKQQTLLWHLILGCIEIISFHPPENGVPTLFISINPSPSQDYHVGAIQ